MGIVPLIVSSLMVIHGYIAHIVMPPAWVAKINGFIHVLILRKIFELIPIKIKVTKFGKLH